MQIQMHGYSEHDFFRCIDLSLPAKYIEFVFSLQLPVCVAALVSRTMF